MIVKPASDKSKFIWNMIGSLCNALSSLIFLSVISRITGPEDAGVFQIAFSAMHLLSTIGLFETRTIQVTDVKEDITFKEYFTFRLVTSSIMVVLAIACIFFGNYSYLEIGVMIMIGVYKVVECIADAFEGMFQQKFRIDLAGKSLGLRVMSCTVVFMIVLFFTRNLILSCTALAFVSIVFLIFYDMRIGKEITTIGIKWDFKNAKSLFLQSIPLFVSSFMVNYIINAPVYAINQYSNNAAQANFGFLIKPAFVINLLTLFVFRPVMTSLAVYWADRKISEFVKLIYQLAVVVAFFSVASIVGAYFLGIPVLNIVSGLELAPHRNDLLIILIGGGMNALITIFYYVITVMKGQNKILLCYCAGFVTALFTTPLLVKKYEVLGACLGYVIPMGVIVTLMILVTISGIVKGKKRANDFIV